MRGRSPASSPPPRAGRVRAVAGDGAGCGVQAACSVLALSGRKAWPRCVPCRRGVLAAGLPGGLSPGGPAWWPLQGVPGHGVEVPAGPPAPECAEDPSLALQLRAVGSRQPPWATVLDGLSPRRLPGRSRPGSCVWFSRFPVHSSPFMPMELRCPQGPSPGHAVRSSHLRKGHPNPGPRGGLSRATTGQGTRSGAVPLWAGAGDGLAEEAGGEGGG